MRFFLPIICVLTLCIVFVGLGDAIVPLGYILLGLLKDASIPLTLRALLLVPFVGTVFSPFVNHMRTRGILESASLLALTGLWAIALVLFVLFPMPGNQLPNAVPLITSIPFLLAVIAAVTHSIRVVLRRARPNSLDPVSRGTI